MQNYYLSSLFSADGDNTCVGCDYPMCSDYCTSIHSNHSAKECEILSRCPKEIRPEILRIDKDKTKASHAYSIITPLRVLLLQERNDDEWQRSNQLIDHHLGNFTPLFFNEKRLSPNRLIVTVGFYL